jgi:hypothetical protein
LAALIKEKNAHICLLCLSGDAAEYPVPESQVARDASLESDVGILGLAWQFADRYILATIAILNDINFHFEARDLGKRPASLRPVVRDPIDDHQKVERTVRIFSINS